LADDIGERLGCGGHVETLRRMAVADFPVEESVTLDELESLDETGRLGKLLPVDCLLSAWPKVFVSAESALALLQGRTVAIAQNFSLGPARLYGEDGVFLGLAEVEEGGRARPVRMVRSGQTAD
jgi:tRNA pseudouridine55 synthase